MAAWECPECHRLVEPEGGACPECGAVFAAEGPEQGVGAEGGPPPASVGRRGASEGGASQRASGRGVVLAVAAIVLVAFAIGLAVVLAVQESDDGPDTVAPPTTGGPTSSRSVPVGTTQAPATTVTVPPPIEAGPPLPIFSFSGRGDAITARFETGQALLRVAVTHDGVGTGAFRMDLRAEEGSRAVPLADDVGAYDGSRYLTVPNGTFAIHVEADGNWSVQIVQPRDRTGARLPVERAGTGAQAVPPVLMEAGAAVLNFTHSSQGPYVVRVLDASGSVLGHAEGIGGAQVEIPVTLAKRGILYIDVDSGGAWNVVLARA